MFKTVAYVAVDEDADADGNAVIEKWPLKSVRAYDTDWVRRDAR